LEPNNRRMLKTIFFIEKNSPEPKAFIRMYEPLEVTKCKKCIKVIEEQT